ncbi:MAG: (Fe-S)-binding protein [bacterium JZ-2024 1]
MREVTLWIPCLMDHFSPESAFSAVKVLQSFGVEVRLPSQPVCCGQPAFNDGYDEEARLFARRFLRLFADTSCIVCTSGSCTAMVRKHFAHLFPPESPEHAEALSLASRVFEFSEFVGRQQKPVPWTPLPIKVAYHPSCHLLYGLGIDAIPNHLLRQIPELHLVDFEESTECCGFGGVFSLRMPVVSCVIADRKLAHLHRSGAEYVTSCDMGCLLHLRARARKISSPLRFVYLAEILARSIR